ncbi:FAD-dependent oxidoreductase [Sphingomonas sp. FARSPH]|uniref:FAD-dependent oxidoreductase n=1 Tax=Sphingomonas sp. FARSPH TaxID=2219696 RepID=UPI001E352C81|nr:NAD(P)/FAD-dependent oxidoreductase [Sphingomonas sp. FARSPH]
MQRHHIAIAGCGPAGLATALLLHRDGHHVTLFERFDAPRPVGSGLMIQPTGLAVLRQLGLADALLDHGARIDRLHGEAGSSGRVVLDVRYAALGRRAGFGVGVHRATLFALLHDAVLTAGIGIETGCAVTGSEMAADDRRFLLLERGRRVGPFDLVVDALGTRTPLAPPCGRALAYGALWARSTGPPMRGWTPAPSNNAIGGRASWSACCRSGDFPARGGGRRRCSGHCVPIGWPHGRPPGWMPGKQRCPRCGPPPRICSTRSGRPTS